MRNQKGISLISLFLAVIIIFLCIVLFMNISNNKDSKIVGTWAFYYGTSYTFNEDGTGSVNAMNTQTKFTYKTKSNKIYITYVESKASFENKYSIKEDKLYIGDDIICTKVK